MRARARRFIGRSLVPQAIRRNLGEMNDEYIARIDGRYRKLQDDGWFDFTIATDASDVAATADALLARIELKRREPGETAVVKDASILD